MNKILLIHNDEKLLGSYEPSIEGLTEALDSIDVNLKNKHSLDTMLNNIKNAGLSIFSAEPIVETDDDFNLAFVDLYYIKKNRDSEPNYREFYDEEYKKITKIIREHSLNKLL